MRNTSIALTAAVVLAAFFAGCSGGGSASSPSTGIMPQTRFEAPAHQLRTKPDLTDFFITSLAIGSYGYNEVSTYDTYGKLIQSFSHGLYFPESVWYDRKGHLYVANYYAPNVQEFNPGFESAAFTYTTGLVNPWEVATDSQLNVYVTDPNGGSVIEYAHRSNAIVYQCSLSNARGVAVDAHGNVFVSYGSSPGHIAEYVGGLSGCSKTIFAPTLSSPSGMIIDNYDDLVVCDTNNGVDIVPPPYSSIKATLAGYGAWHVALNKNNSYLFVANPIYNETYVYHYISGIYYTEIYGAGPLGVAVQ